tara:strand:- start:861 stop:1475 length:615 start_codon:yes stop_codon:yes gene_type:complete
MSKKHRANLKMGWIYWHPFVYNSLLFLLYNGRPHDRFKEIAKEICDGDDVIDLCAGNDFLFKNLAKRPINYTAYDINLRFINSLKNKGINAYKLDVSKENIPKGDVIVLASALYHFYPDCQKLIDRMLEKAEKKVVIVEPIRNAVNSTNKFIADMAERAGRVNNCKTDYRFDEDSLRSLLDSVKVPMKTSVICNGRDLCAVFYK